MYKVKMLTLKDGLPKRLGQLSDAPDKLYLKGDFKFDGPTLAVVGTRQPSRYGVTVTEQLIHSLRGQGIGIISGLALGTDGLAHKAAINAGLQTLAVLPCGIDGIYPKSNRRLAEDILSQGGGFLSEYAGDTNPRKDQFIARNRLVAACADAVLIPEAAKKSGSLHTANFALDLGVEVLAVPGPINSILSEGTNGLIKNGARPVLNGADILDALGLSAKTKQVKLTFENIEEEKIYTELCKEALGVEDLQIKTGIPAVTLSQTLTMMEIEGTIRCQSGIWSV